MNPLGRVLPLVFILAMWSRGFVRAFVPPVIQTDLQHPDPAAVITPEEAAFTADLLWSSAVERLVARSEAATSRADGGSQLTTRPSAFHDHASRVVVLAFSRSDPELMSALLASAPARTASEQGVDIQPSWAHGAKVFVRGIGAEHVEAPIVESLLPRHVILYDTDLDDLFAALSHLPYRIRKLKPESGGVGQVIPGKWFLFDISSDATEEVGYDAGQDLEIRVENTFVQFSNTSLDTRSVRSAEF